LREQNKRPPVPGRSPFQVDLDRIVFSAAFRRLQDKTQVHPLTDSDYVRKRLTHSMEVASVGRSLGTGVGARICDTHSNVAIQAAEVGYIVQAACLAHDIGNPPYGHGGEEAIRRWFHEHPEVLANLTPRQRAELLAFEGNAQGFRLLTRHEIYDDDGGLRLTHATLGAFCKYPTAADAIEPKGTPGRYIGAKKVGFFDSEHAFMAEVAAAVGLLARGSSGWVRHPLVFLMEAADDICYGVIDLEDGYDAGFIPFAEVRDLLEPIVRPGRDSPYANKDETGRVQFLRARAIGRLIDAAITSFTEHENEILTGRFNSDLISVSAYGEAHVAMTTLARTCVFDDPRVVSKELAGFAVLAGLLDAFYPVVAALEDAGWNPTGLGGKERRLLRLVPGLERCRSTYTGLLAVTDLVSGMTDRAAVQLYHRLGGTAF
jgi:dGTPase